MGYLANFMVYTLAMVGVIVVALLVFKGATSTGGGRRGSKYLSIIDTMSLGPRKTLYIVSAGSEKFLIAGDVDKTTLISKLDISSEKESVLKNDVLNNFESSTDSFKETLNSTPKTSYIDKSVIGIKSSLMTNNKQNNVMRNLADVLRR